MTGSTAEIGSAAALGPARKGASVVVNGRTPLRVDKAVKSSTESVPEADIVIGSMGVFEPKAFAEINSADWLRFFEINVLSGMRLSRAYRPGTNGAGLRVDGGTLRSLF